VRRSASLHRTLRELLTIAFPIFPLIAALRRFASSTSATTDKLHNSMHLQGIERLMPKAPATEAKQQWVANFTATATHSR
jgi:hypothetical protein